MGKVVEKLKRDYYYKDELLEVRLQRTRHNSFELPDYLYLDSPKEIFQNIEKDGYIFECLPFLRRIISGIENKGWVDIETDYYELLKDYALNKRGDVKQLNEELSYIEKKLIEYLKEVEKGYFSPNPIIKTFGEEIKKMIYEGIALRDVSLKYNRSSRNKEQDKQGKVVLLNFNYTKIADQYFGNENADFFVNHIHGKLDDEDSVIFGYGDELDKKYKEIEELNDNEYLEKIKSVKYLERDNYRKIQAFIDEPFQVYIMGHSCGNSDRTLLNTIFEHENCVSIKPFYYAYKDKEGDDRDNYTEIVRNITRNFNDKQLLRERVVNKTYCKPLPQSEIKYSIN